jgi:thiaminase
MKSSLRNSIAAWLVAALCGVGELTPKSADAAEETRCGRESGSAAAVEAKKLLGELRGELADVENQIRNHPYLKNLEGKQVSQANLKAFAGEQYNIIRSDLRSDALMVTRFGTTNNGKMLRDIMDGEVQALGMLLDFAKALGLDEDQLRSYEPRPGAQAYPAYAASLALYGSEADIAAALLMNFSIFGENTGRMSAALKSNYGLTPRDVAFFDFFASPMPDFECDALAMIEAGLEHGAEPYAAKRAARLLQAYEKLFWDTVAEEK